MRKLIAAILLLTMVLCLCACGEDPNPAQTTTTPKTPNTTTTTATTTVSDGKVTYTVTVTDESGNPVAGAMIQMCKDACVPGRTNDQGVAEFRLAQDSYKVSFLVMPEGYGYMGEATEFYFETGATELTIQLKKVN